jgi:peptide/nickel transport system permease protein
MTRSAYVGGAMLAVFAMLGVLGPWLAPHQVGVAGHDLAGRFGGSSATHWLGTDSNGVDTFSQLLWGARSALVLSAIVVSISATIGIAVGTSAGWYRGWVDAVIMRCIDILMAFPGLLLNIAIVSIVARPGLGVVVLALCANGWVGYARVARGQVLALRERDFITATVALGASDVRVMARHLVPNLLGPALVQISFGFAGIILVEATLSFLGLGPQVDYTWGAMLAQAREVLWKDDWVAGYALVPGIAVVWVVLGANLLGDGLRDRLDPRVRTGK